MPNVSFSELIVILMILLLVFGASRLPALGESLGRTVRSFKRGMNNDPSIQIEQDANPEAAKPRQRSAEIADAELVDKKPGS